MISIEEYNKRINWSLEQKVDHALYIIENFIAQYPKCNVSFSGGVDSTVMLWLVRLIDKNRKAVFVNTTNEFPDIIKFVKKTENTEIITPNTTFVKTIQKYGFPLISKKVARMITDLRNPTPNNVASRNLYLTGIKIDGTKSKSFKLPERYKHLIDAPFAITYKCCNELKKKPFSKLNKNGVFIGTMATDSGTRKGAYLKTGCINFLQNKAMPLSIFTKKDINYLIKKYNIPYCEIYDKGETNTGCAYCGFGCQLDKTRFDRLKILEPKRYESMMNLENNGIRYKDAIQIALKKQKREVKNKKNVPIQQQLKM